MSAPESTPRDLVKLLDQAREENKQLRERWSSLKRLVLGEWQRGSKMPYSVVKPFLEGNGHAIPVEMDEDNQSEAP